MLNLNTPKANIALTPFYSTYNPNTLEKDLNTYQGYFSQEVLEWGWVSVLSVFVFALWVYIFARVLRPFRLSPSGIPKDGSFLITFVIIVLATLCTVFSMVIGYDIYQSLK